MKTKTPKKPSVVLRPEPPRSRAGLYRVGRWLGSNQPDLRRNPRFWPLWMIYSPALIRKTIEVAGLGHDVADLGCGNGWLSWEVARRHPQVRILGVDKDAAQLEWAKDYFEYRKPGRPVGEITYQKADLTELELLPGSLDVAICFFSLGQLKEPLKVLESLQRALRPGGVIVYYDATEPSSLNLDRRARWRHRLQRMSGRMSDLWNQQRRTENLYLDDAVRRFRHPEAPPEEDVFHFLEENFEVYHHQRVRAFLDLVVDQNASRRLSLMVYKLLDDLAIATHTLHGCCRYVLARQR